jgi:uncharacterized protein
VSLLLVWLTLASFLSWFTSTLAAAGSPLLLIPLVNLLLGSGAVAPVITLGMLLGNSQRIILFWSDINWKITFWYLPGAIAGAILGAYLFTQLNLDWLQLLIGLFLILSVVGFWSKKQESSFSVETWYFLPAGFVYAFISGLIGSSGPLLNPLYLKYGLVKEEMIATKAANVVVIHVFKIIIYLAFGAMTPQYLGYGLAIGLAAAPGNWLGRYVLRSMSNQHFRQLALATMGLTGILMLWQQRDLLHFIH